ncbi:MAG: Crp/Fnr family transcriptional regulator [Cyanobacteriota bacterium]|nr:Crp/Fnr family transcriptional regulator [Cyanobacteriota bacterium]
MSSSQSSRNPVANQLLAAIPRGEYERLLPHLEFVCLPIKQVLHEANEPIEYAYFPLTVVASVLTLMSDGEAIEAATVGKEAMVGVPLLLGTQSIPNQVVAQIPGEALRMKADVFIREVYWGCPLHTLLLRYTQTLMNQFAQTAACNRLHSVEERCCRWLLMTHDRVESDEFLLTQEFLSIMLGVRRASVSVVAAMLQQAGFIRYHRGRMTILNREGLESASCECYQALKQECDRLIG